MKSLLLLSLLVVVSEVRASKGKKVGQDVGRVAKKVYGSPLFDHSPGHIVAISDAVNTYIKQPSISDIVAAPNEPKLVIPSKPDRYSRLDPAEAEREHESYWSENS